MFSTYTIPHRLYLLTGFYPTFLHLSALSARVSCNSAPPATQLRTFRKSDLSADELTALLARPRIDFTSILNTVKGAVGDVVEVALVKRRDIACANIVCRAL